jgi:hypothetical protein
VGRLVDLAAPGPRAFSPRGGARFDAADGTVLEVRELLYFGSDLDAHQTYDAELVLPGPRRRRKLKVQVDVTRFTANIGEVVIRQRSAPGRRVLDHLTWHRSASAALDAIYLPERPEAVLPPPAARQTDGPAGDGTDDGEDEAAA